MTQQLFSNELHAWLQSKKPKTIGAMLDTLDEKGFAFLFFILLLLPALPIPTAGLSHVFEAIACLVAVQLMIGRREVWIPDFLAQKQLPQSLAQRIIPYTIKRVRFFEKYTSSNMRAVLRTKIFRVCLGLFVVVFSGFAFFAPPLSMLDTLPSLGVVGMSLGVILDDIRIVMTGWLVGMIGVVLTVALSGSILYIVAQSLGLL
jgi:hypothetical protein